MAEEQSRDRFTGVALLSFKSVPDAIRLFEASETANNLDSNCCNKEPKKTAHSWTVSLSANDGFCI